MGRPPPSLQGFLDHTQYTEDIPYETALPPGQPPSPAPRTQQHADRNRPTREKGKGQRSGPRLGVFCQSQVKRTGSPPATEGHPHSLHTGNLSLLSAGGRGASKPQMVTADGALLCTDAKATGAAEAAAAGAQGPGLSQHSHRMTTRSGDAQRPPSQPGAPCPPEPGGSQLLAAQGALTMAVGRAQSSLVSTSTHSWTSPAGHQGCFQAKPLPPRSTSDHRTLKRKRQGLLVPPSRPSAHSCGQQFSRLLGGGGRKAKGTGRGRKPRSRCPLFKEHKAANRQTPSRGQPRAPPWKESPQGLHLRGAQGKAAKAGAGPRLSLLPRPSLPTADRGNTQGKPPREDPAPMGKGPPSADSGSNELHASGLCWLLPE